VNDELFEKYLSNRLTADEAAALKRVLASDQQARAQFVQTLQEWQLFAEAARQITAGSEIAEAAAPTANDPLRRRRPSQRVPPLPRRRPARRMAMVLLPLVGLAACLAIVLLMPSQAAKAEPFAAFSMVQPGVVLQRGDSKLVPAAGMALLPGDAVSVVTGSHASVRYADDTRLDLAPGTTVTLVGGQAAPGAALGVPGKRVLVTSGSVTAEVAKQPLGHPMQFLTPQAQATVLGTKLILDVVGAATRLEVVHGLVGLSRRAERTMIEVAGGQCATVAEGVELAARAIIADVTVNAEGEHRPGIKTEYFADTSLSKLMFTRTDATVSYDPGLETPPLDISPSHFSVRWSGTIQPRFSETYMLHLEADSGVRLFIDGKVLIDDSAASVVSDHQVAVAFEAGKRYPLRIEYIQPKAGMMIKLRWESLQQAMEIVPTERLSPDP
jgi:ferric-dicitrate binding protein FerR (iron transport regulator)